MVQCKDVTLVHGTHTPALELLDELRSIGLKIYGFAETCRKPNIQLDSVRPMED
jgi:hypothetical protein